MQTSPKLPAFAIDMTSRGTGVLPVRLTVFGLAGSLLMIVMVAAAAPRFCGWKRIGSSTESPAATINGYDATLGGTKSMEDDVMLSIDSGHGPRLLITS